MDFDVARGNRLRLLPVFQEGERVLAAVSGGADSTALLLLLTEARDAGKIYLACAHYRHGIRPDADADRDFVRDLCARLSVPFYEGAGDAPARAAEKRCGLETAARALRRAFLLETMRVLGAQAVATAHHADDQAETVLMHLLRGSSLSGAAGMRPRDGAWARPLLNATRREIVAYLTARGQAWRTDETNAVPDNPRNALRLRAMPEIERIYPGAARALARFSSVAADEDEYMRAQARDWLAPRARKMPFGCRLAAEDAPPALVRRAMRALLAGVSPDGDFPPDAEGFERLDALQKLYAARRGALEWGNVRAERTGDWLYLIDQTARPFAGEIPLADGARLPGIGAVYLRPCEAAPVRGDLFRQAADARAISGAVLRTRRAGDRMRMLGAPGDKLLSDILTDRKIDRPLRDWTPLVAAGDRILWIPGVCLSREAALREDTQDATEMRFMREEPV